MHIIGIIATVAILAVDIGLLFLKARNMNLFYFIAGLALVIGALPFIFSLMMESRTEKENNEMFLEFSRNLVESVKAGTPISKAIINLRDKYFGSLTPNIQKLANQISLGIPVKNAFEVFARDVDSRAVRRAVTLISEAEKAGGQIEGILDSVAKSVGETEKLKKERQAAIYGVVVQGHIIFFIFIAIMLIMQFKIIPMTSDLGGGNMEGVPGFNISSGSENVSMPMLVLLIVQGLFTGLVIGKLAEGKFKSGIKHSFIMIAVALLIYTGAKTIF